MRFFAQFPTHLQNKEFKFTYNCNTVKKETTATPRTTPSVAQAKYTMTVFNFKWKYEKKTTTATAAVPSLNKRINEQTNGCARAL